MESESFLSSRDYRHLNTSKWVKFAILVIGFSSATFLSLILNCTPYFDKTYPGMSFVFYGSVILRGPSFFILPVLTWLKGVRYGQQIKWSLVILLICFLLSIFASLKWPETLQGFATVLGLYSIAATANMVTQLSIPRVLNYYHSACLPYYYSPGPINVIIGALLGLVLLSESVPSLSYITVFGVFAVINYVSMLIALIMLQRTSYFFKNDMLHAETDENSLSAYIDSARDTSEQFWNMFWLNLVVAVTFKTIIYSLHPPHITKPTWTLMMIILGFSCESLGKGMGRAQFASKLLSVTTWYPWFYTVVVLGFFFLASPNMLAQWYIYIIVLFAVVDFRFGLGITQYATQVNTLKIGDPNSLMMVNISREFGLAAGAILSVGVLWIREYHNTN